MSKQRSKGNWFRRWRNVYRLVLIEEQSFEERFNFRLTRMNTFLFIVSLSVIFILITFFLIAYTPIREYIPGYPSFDQRKQLYQLQMTADSLAIQVHRQELYLENIRNILNNSETLLTQPVPGEENLRYDSITISRSEQDSILRAEFEAQEMFNLYFSETGAINESSLTSIRSFNFYRPLNGIITSRFDIAEKHYGIDVVTGRNEAVMATLEGTVIYAGWTIETGHVIALQHLRNLVSIYKHNSVLLKKEGDIAKAGEPIAIAGQSGELATGPHLHFELWYNGTPMDPEEYIIFN